MRERRDAGPLAPVRPTGERRSMRSLPPRALALGLLDDIPLEPRHDHENLVLLGLSELELVETGDQVPHRRRPFRFVDAEAPGRRLHVAANVEARPTAGGAQ